jgi:peptidase E
MQSLYRVQLEHASNAVLDVWNHEGEPSIRRAARRSALGVMRRLDHEHLLAIERVHEDFARRVMLTERKSVAPHRNELARLIGEAGAVLIAGGHVAILANRLRFLGFAALLQGKPILAWSAGAMAISERIVLFHDQPPQGPGVPELFDQGLAMVPGVLPLPHAQTRLHLHDSEHISILARRFAPQHCMTLDHGSVVSYVDGRAAGYANSWRLTRDGTLAEGNTA